MAPFPAHPWTAATRKPRMSSRSSGVSPLRYAGRLSLVKLRQLLPRKTRNNPGRARWIGGRRRGVVFPIIPIGAPFPNIAQHIIQSPGIRALLAYRVSLAVTVVAKPDMLALLANVIAPREQAGHPRPAGVFPLRLRGQAVAVTTHVGDVSAVDAVERRPLVFLAQLVAEIDHIQPGDGLHRQVVRSLEIARVTAHDRLVLALRDRMDSQEKWPGDLDGMLGLLIVVPLSLRFGEQSHELIDLLLGRAHQERPGLDANQGHADRTGPFSLRQGRWGLGRGRRRHP